MRKVVMMLMLVLGLAVLTGCGSSDPISIVKNGTMYGYEEITVGQAFDNWKRVKSYEWTKFETNNGKVIVQWKGIRDVSWYSVLIVQWAINVDGGFKLNYMGDEFFNTAGDTKSRPMHDIPGYLSIIYRNN